MGGNGDGLFSVIAATAATAAASLALVQTDFISRKVLDPKKLDAKRRTEYQYNWKTSMEKAYLQLDYCLAGGMSTYEKDEQINAKNTEFLSSDEDLDSLVQRICKDKKSKFCSLKIDRDSNDPNGEFYLYIMDKNNTLPRYQLPLMDFGVRLAKAFEDQLTTTTLCFVADASSGKGTSLLEQLVCEAKTGVAILSEPLWLVQLARLVEANLFLSEKIQKLLFALCRMEAWCLREEAKESHTVMITLPGQATTATLLPLVQTCFPEDRHVFVYDGCAASVQRGIAARQAFGRGKIQDNLDNVLHSLCEDPVIHTVPLPSQLPLTKSVSNLENSLSLLPIAQAQIVETWMGSVDAFFKLKEDEFSNGYLPYILKLKYVSTNEFKPNSESYWILCSVLQYITGTRSRPLAEGVIDLAIEWMKDYNEKEQEPPVSISDTDKKLIEECVFNHKLILLGDKTLKDTVQGRQHWTLKEAAKKGGCACCGPDPLEEIEEEDERKAAMMKKARGLDVADATEAKPSTPKSSGFVDGKLGFAFDPTRFS